MGLAEPLDGILGLSRDKVFWLWAEEATADGFETGPLYVKALKENGFTTENTFSIFMRPKDKQSHIDFGTPQESAMRDPLDIVYTEVLDDFFWSMFNTGVAIGSLTPADMWGYQ